MALYWTFSRRLRNRAHFWKSSSISLTLPHCSLRFEEDREDGAFSTEPTPVQRSWSSYQKTKRAGMSRLEIQLLCFEVRRQRTTRVQLFFLLWVGRCELWSKVWDRPFESRVYLFFCVFSWSGWVWILWRRGSHIGLFHFIFWKCSPGYISNWSKNFIAGMSFPSCVSNLLSVSPSTCILSFEDCEGTRRRRRAWYALIDSARKIRERGWGELTDQGHSFLNMQLYVYPVIWVDEGSRARLCKVI